MIWVCEEISNIKATMVFYITFLYFNLSMLLVLRISHSAFGIYILLVLEYQPFLSLQNDLAFQTNKPKTCYSYATVLFTIVLNCKRLLSFLNKLGIISHKCKLLVQLLILAFELHICNSGNINNYSCTERERIKKYSFLESLISIGCVVSLPFSNVQ